VATQLISSSQELFTEAKRYIPGGVNSPVRSFEAVGGYPIFVKSGKGAKIYSEEGARFIDYCLSWGALILGHANLKVIKPLKEVADLGTSFGVPTRQETALTKKIVEAIPSIEQVRLTNSGTEAVMTAIRLARAYTQKNKIIKFQGAYHGHADYLLDCQGIPYDFKRNTLIARYNDIKNTKKIIEKHTKDIAAIIVEPVAANMGVVSPRIEFLQGLSKAARENNIVLIFDEVITGFRLSYGGAQGLFGIKPDLTTLGKIIGGGLPIGAIGGRREIMGLLAPVGNVYQAGTFSGNPISVNAGLATLKILFESNPYSRLKAIGHGFCKGIKERAKIHKINIRLNSIGSMFSIFFTDKRVYDYNSVRRQDIDLFKKFYQGLLKEGIFFSPSALETNFLSTAHSEQDIEKTLKVIDKVFRNIRRSNKAQAYGA